MSIWFVNSTNTFAQFGIVKNYVFTQYNFAGTIAVDEQGKQLTPGVTSSVTIYLQTNASTMPLFDSAKIDGKFYAIESVAIKEKKVIVGKNELDEKPIFITVTDKFNLYKISIYPPIVPALEKPYQILKITLQGKFKGKKVFYSIHKKPISLNSIPMP